MNISKKKSIFLLAGLLVGLTCSTESKATNLFTYTKDLSSAVHTGDVSTVEKLLTQKRYILPRLFVEINHLLFEAAKYNQIEVVELLLKMGANVNASGWSFWNMRENNPSYPSYPLLIAVANNHAKMVEFLIKHGADVETSFFKDNTTSFTKSYIKTVLHLAAEKGFDEIVEILLRNGASVDGQRYQVLFIVETPLSLAIKNGHIKTVKVLLENGALQKETHLPFYDDHTLKIAIKKNNIKIAKLLIKFGAKIQPYYLVLAWLKNNQEMINLIERAIQIDQSFNKEKQQALEALSREKQFALQEILIY